MRKGLVAILAVAIIGSLGIYSQGNSKSTQTAPDASTAASDNRISANSPTARNSSSTSGFEDGTYTGTIAQTSYGPVEVAVIISGGKITDVNFLQMPNDLGHTQEVTAQSEPILKQETLDA